MQLLPQFLFDLYQILNIAASNKNTRYIFRVFYLTFISRSERSKSNFPIFDPCDLENRSTQKPGGYVMTTHQENLQLQFEHSSSNGLVIAAFFVFFCVLHKVPPTGQSYEPIWPKIALARDFMTLYAYMKYEMDR